MSAIVAVPNKPDTSVVEHRFYKARPIGIHGVESVAIILDTEVPEVRDGNWQEAAMEYYRGDAELLERVLHETLPGGTYAELLRAMLLRRASHFAVAFADPKPPKIEDPYLATKPGSLRKPDSGEWNRVSITKEPTIAPDAGAGA